LPALVSSASRAKRSVDDSHSLLSEAPLLKRWRHLGAADDLNESDTEADPVVDDKKRGESDVPNGVVSRTSAGGNANRSLEEDEMRNCDGETAEVDISHLDKSLGKVKRIVPFANGELDKRPASKASSKREAESVAVLLRRKAVEAILEPDMSTEDFEATVRNSVQLQHKSPAVPQSFATEVDCCKKGVKAEDLGEDAVEASVNELAHRPRELTEALISSKTGVVAEKEVAEAQHVGTTSQQRPVIQFDMEKARRKFELFSLQGQNSSSSRRQMPRKRYTLSLPIN
jgi:hypothetical protein